MEYSKKLFALLSRAKEANKKMNFFQIFPLIPLFLSQFLYVATFYIADLLFTFLSSPIKVLENWQKEQLKEVRHATEAIIALITTPFLFFMQIMLSFFSFFFCVLWFMIMCLTYLTTFGRVKWQPYLMSAQFDEEDENANLPFKRNKIVLNIYFAISFIVAVMSIICWFVYYIGDIYHYSYPVIFSFFNSLQFILTVIVNPLILNKDKSSLKTKSENDEDKEIGDVE